MGELQSLIGKLKEHNKSCEDKCLDLKTLKFEAKESEMRLYDESKSYYFKNDPKNPKDPKVIHAKKQFSKLLGVPYSFLAKNPDYMKIQMASCWIPTLKPEQAQVLAKLRASKDSCVIRALLPVEFTNISNADIMEMVCEATGDGFRVEFCIGDERDDLIIHARFISKTVFEACGESCSVGFSVIASELGASPLSVDTMLFRNTSKASMIASYSGESFFENKYEGIQPDDLKSLFPQLVNRLKTQLPELKDKIQSAKETVEKKEDIRKLLEQLRLKRGLSDKFHTLMYQELEKDGTVHNRWDFVNKMAVLAKDFEVVARLRIEKAAGELVGLIFEKV